MPTTFEVIELQVLTYNSDGRTYFMDEQEGNSSAELANLLEGFTFGSAANPIFNGVRVFEPGSTGFAPGAATAYDTNNTATGGETFLIGGEERTFDAIAVYNATITYVGGGTANITAVVFQDTDGMLYLAPEISNNADSAALSAGQIQSLRLNTVNNATNINFAADRFQTDFVCFTAGMTVDTPHGPVPVEQVRGGDLVCTADNGVQRVAWAGGRRVGQGGVLEDAMKPVIIRAGHFGATRDLMVSQQHAVVMPDGQMARAKHLAELPGPGARIAKGCRSVHYIHLFFERHQVLMTDGLRSESLYPGPMGLRMLDDAGRAGIEALLPQTRWVRLGLKRADAIYGATARPILGRRAVLEQYGAAVAA